jgi:hypothetical protein
VKVATGLVILSLSVSELKSREAYGPSYYSYGRVLFPHTTRHAQYKGQCWQTQIGLTDLANRGQNQGQNLLLAENHSNVQISTRVFINENPPWDFFTTFLAEHIIWVKTFPRQMTQEFSKKGNIFIR